MVVDNAPGRGYRERVDLWRRGSARAAGAAAVALCSLYFLLLPLCWPPPAIRARLPARARLDGEAAAEVTVSAWHGNARLVQAYLVLEVDDYQARGLPAALLPVTLYESGPIAFSGASLSRWTWPHRARYRFPLPLRALAAQGLAVPGGTLRGQVHVTVAYPGPGALHRRRAQVPHVPATRQLTVPFTLALDP